MQEINITIPAISSDLIATLTTETIETRATETLALQAVREKYSPLARQNGYVRTGYQSWGDQNYSGEREAYYRVDGKRVKALLCVSTFDTENSDQNRGSYVGSRLYLLATGEWLRIVRAGHWSQWQGEGQGWQCGDVEWDGKAENSEADWNTPIPGGSVTVIDDAQALSFYAVDKVIAGLSESLAEMQTKLPERLAKVRQRAKLAGELLAALK